MLAKEEAELQKDKDSLVERTAMRKVSADDLLKGSSQKEL